VAVGSVSLRMRPLALFLAKFVKCSSPFSESISSSELRSTALFCRYFSNYFELICLLSLLQGAYDTWSYGCSTMWKSMKH
jgi:hypothetical protein